MHPFRTFEISNPQYETAGLRHVTVKSSALGRRADITLFIPPGIQGPEIHPLLILLHGVYGSHWAWAYSAGAHITAAQMMNEGILRPMVIAMPSDGLWGDGSGYLNHVSGSAYEDWIVSEVPTAARQAVPHLLSEESPMLICGLSMGGYGALRLGLKHPERFSAISAHSSITQASQLADFIEEPLNFAGELDDPSLDPMNWARINRYCMPPLRFDCGTEDQLLQANRLLHNALLDEGIPHLYYEYDGAHCWDYWQQHLRDSLLFFERTLQQ